jgi:hypothetical protein
MMPRNYCGIKGGTRFYQLCHIGRREGHYLKGFGNAVGEVVVGEVVVVRGSGGGKPVWHPHTRP